MPLEDSVLLSVKKVIGVHESNTVFDEDILTAINSAFSKLQQIGVGPTRGFFVEDESTSWDEFVRGNAYNMVRSFITLHVKMEFDPPTSGFLIEARKAQLDEYLWRLSHEREWQLNPTDPREEELA